MSRSGLFLIIVPEKSTFDNPQLLGYIYIQSRKMTWRKEGFGL